MTTEEVAHMNEARSSLARQRNAIVRKIGPLDLAPVSLAEELPRRRKGVMKR